MSKPSTINEIYPMLKMVLMMVKAKSLDVKGNTFKKRFKEEIDGLAQRIDGDFESRELTDLIPYDMMCVTSKELVNIIDNYLLNQRFENNHSARSLCDLAIMNHQLLKELLKEKDPHAHSILYSGGGIDLDLSQGAGSSQESHNEGIGW